MEQMKNVEHLEQLDVGKYKYELATGIKDD